MTLSGFFPPYLVRKDIAERACSSTDSGDSAGGGCSVGYKSVARGICCSETFKPWSRAAGISSASLRCSHKGRGDANVRRDLVILGMGGCARDPAETRCCAQMVHLGQSVICSLWWFGFSSSETESLMPVTSCWAQEPFQIHRLRYATWGHPSLITGWKFWSKPSAFLFLACL